MTSLTHFTALVTSFRAKSTCVYFTWRLSEVSSLKSTSLHFESTSIPRAKSTLMLRFFYTDVLMIYAGNKREQLKEEQSGKQQFSTGCI